MYIKVLLFLILILCPFISNGQKESYDSLKKIVERDLNFLNSYNFFDSIYENVDIDSLATITAKKVVKLLSYQESKELNQKPLYNLELTASYGDSLIRIYIFSYGSGGTRGSISHPIIQWQKKDGSFTAYNLSKKNYSGFGNIEKLNSGDKELYLLFGTEKGNSSHIMFTAYIIQFNKDYLILDYPAFYGSSYLIIDNVEMNYDKKSRILKISSWYDEIQDNLIHMEYDLPHVYNELKDCFTENGSCELKFDGKKFVK